VNLNNGQQQTKTIILNIDKVRGSEERFDGISYYNESSIKTTNKKSMMNFFGKIRIDSSFVLCFGVHDLQKQVRKEILE